MVLLAAFPRPAAWTVVPGTPIGRPGLLEHGWDDPEVSTRHLQIDRRGPGATVQDLGSRNGTWLDGQPLAPNVPVQIADGALLRVGSTLCVFRGSFEGELRPAEPLGAVMVGPFGLRRMQAALEAWARLPPANVLLLGETGTGKELAARVVAETLGRGKRYAAVNVAGVASGVFESQLFGHVAGAFSDARRSSPGVVAAHEGGAVLLDEIGDLALELQSKLLRLLDNREILPVGAERPVRVDVLFIAATNRSPRELADPARFRQDLLARFAVAQVRLPPLRDRREDIYAIARTLGHNLGHAIEPEACEVEAVERLLLHDWPSNARELMGVLAGVAEVDPAPGLRLWALQRVLGPSAEARPPLHPDAVAVAIEGCGGNESQAARRLGITRGRLRRLLGKA
jgi:DNA-binding NtrC family response regulator